MPAPRASTGPSASSPSDSARVVCVDPAFAAKIWPHAKPFIAAAFATGLGDSTLEATEACVLSGMALLWVAWSNRAIVAAAVTELLVMPRHKVCIVAAGAGNGKAGPEFLRQVECYARAEGCQLVRVMGRRGWQRRLKDYRQPWIVLEKRIED